MHLLVTTRDLGKIPKDILAHVLIDYHSLIMNSSGADVNKFKHLLDLEKAKELNAKDYPEEVQSFVTNGNIEGWRRIIKSKEAKLSKPFSDYLRKIVKEKFRKYYSVAADEANKIHLFWTLTSEVDKQDLKVLILKNLIAQISENQEEVSLLLHNSDWENKEGLGELLGVRSINYFTHEPWDSYNELIIKKLIEGKPLQAWNNFNKVPEIKDKLKERERLIWEGKRDEAEKFKDYIFDIYKE